MLSVCRSLIALFGLLAVLVVGIPPVSGAAAHAKHAATGKIRGTVRAAGVSTGRMQFYLDGARARPRLQKGIFLLAGVPVGAHVLSVTCNGGDQGAHVAATVSARAVTDVGTVQLQTGGQITGIVSQLDPDTGSLTPLKGVTVLAQRPLVVPPCVLAGAGAGGATPGIICPQPGGPTGGSTGPIIDPLPPLHATTDENGVYTFESVPPGGYRVSVVVPGLEAGVEFVTVAAGDSVTAEFQLRLTIPDGVGTVNGTVTGPDGAPIEAALITIYSPDTFYPPVIAAESVEHARLNGHSAGALPITLPRSSFSTLTDAQGHYSLNVPTGYVRLDAYAASSLPVTVTLTVLPAQAQTVDLKLDAPPAGGAIEGEVTASDTGEPLAGATVTVLIAVPLGKGDRHVPTVPPNPVLQTVTDEDGHYRLEGLPEGSLPVQASAAGYRPSTRNVKVSDGETSTLEFELVPRRIVPVSNGKG